MQNVSELTLPAPRSSDDDPRNRRRSPRVAGPFVGTRGGLLPVDIQIHDLSIGGCLIQSFLEEAGGRRIKIAIELPYEGWIHLQAETLYTRVDYGFAVKWVDVSPDVHAKLESVINRLLTRRSLDD